MAQTGFTPIQIYSTSTAAAAPTAGNLANSTLGSELAINITDGKLFYKDNANVVQVIGWKTVPTTAGGTGLNSYAAGDLLFYASGTALSKLAIGANTTVMTSSGSAPQWTAQSALSVGTAANLLSNATSGVMQITGPGAGTTRVMTIPNTNFTAARTDAAQSFTGNQTFNDAIGVGTSPFGWAAYKSIDIGTQGGIASVSSQMQTFQNALFNGGWVYKANGFAANYNLLSGQHVWQRAVSGLAGGAITWIENGKFDENGNLSVANGNLVIGTSGKGIDFSATPGTGTSELFADYEEGTWTPVCNPASGSITTQTCSGTYTKVGRLITVQMSIVINNAGTATGLASISGLPYTSANTADVGSGAIREYNATGFEWNYTVNPNATAMYPARYDNVNVIATNYAWRGSVTYTV